MFKTLVAAALVFLVCYGTAVAEPTFSDAQLLATTVCPCLLAPDSLVQRIANDLQVIRTQYPVVANIHLSCPSPVPGAICLCLTADELRRFLAGTHEQLNAIHAQLGQPQMTAQWDCFVYLSFAVPYRPQTLVELYASTPGVYFAEPINGCFETDRIEILNDGAYSFCRAWGEDCPNGCEHHHYWIFSVSGNEATLIREYGDTAAESTSWGQMKARFRR